MSPSHGLAVDNVLSYHAVLANGSAVVASACSHPDLFWALRGGGGGTFAVVTSVTYRLHPVAATTGVFVMIYMVQGQTSAVLLLDAWLAATPGLTNSAAHGVVWGGYFYGGVNNDTSYWEAVLMCNGTQTAANTSLASFVSFVGAHPEHFYVATYSVTSYPSALAWHQAITGGVTDATGNNVALASRLVPSAVCSDPAARASAVATLVRISSTTPLAGHLVAGGAVAAFDGGSKATSVTPAWRAATVHYVVGASWGNNASMAEQADAYNQATGWAGELRNVFPDSGAYWNEAVRGAG